MRTEAEIRHAIAVTKLAVRHFAATGDVLAAGAQPSVIVALEWALGAESEFGDALAKINHENATLRLKEPL